MDETRRKEIVDLYVTAGTGLRFLPCKSVVTELLAEIDKLEAQQTALCKLLDGIVDFYVPTGATLPMVEGVWPVLQGSE